MYIAHPSILKDLQILFATIKILFIPESTEGVDEGAFTAMGEPVGCGNKQVRFCGEVFT